MTEQARNITLADPEAIADLLQRFDERLKANGLGMRIADRDALVMAYHNQLLIQLTDPPDRCGVLWVAEPDA